MAAPSSPEFYLETLIRLAWSDIVLNRWPAHSCLARKRTKMITLQLEKQNCSIYLRSEQADIAVYREIFVDRQHAIDLSFAPRAIIDGGGNIGMAAVDFALRHPLARIITIEPEKANFEILRMNVRAFPNITPIRAALWKHETELALLDPGLGAWGFRTSADPSEMQRSPTVSALTVQSIMDNFKIDVIDILKLDIEGAEREVFETSSVWINKVRVLIVELHEEFSAGCKHAFESATQDFDYEYRGGGKIVCRRRNT